MDSARVPDEHTRLFGHRLRELRLARGIRQADLARRLNISPAYLNLLEKGKRTMQFPVLLSALSEMGVELGDFIGSLGGHRPDNVLAALLDDPLARTLDLDSSSLGSVGAEPRVAATIAALFHLYKNTRAELEQARTELATEARSQPTSAAPSTGYGPGDEVVDFLQNHHNFFPEIETLAEEVRAEARLPRRFVSDQLADVLRTRFSLDVNLAAPGTTSVVRHYDPATGKVVISTSLSESAVKFQLGHVLGLHLLAGRELDRKYVNAAELSHSETAHLIRIHLANYFAGAVILPYGDFFSEVQRTRYDVLAVAQAFEATYEAVAHRMCNLSDEKRRGVPLHFLRVDVAGNISKRYSATGIRFPRQHGSCPKWAVHTAFLTPAVISKQYSRMPGGETFFCFAKVLSEPAVGSTQGGPTYSIGLGTSADNARHFAYADALPADADQTAVRTGITCRFCERADCNQRAAASLKYAFSVDENIKKENFFSPVTEADSGSMLVPAPGPRKRK